MKYTVKKGDTLWGISNQYGVNVSDLAKINNVTADTLKVGMVLSIPSVGGNNPDNMFMYTVKKGDSLWSISKIYSTSVEEIKRINNLTSNTLYIGQVLRIPEMYTKEENMIVPSYINYKVVSGDTLYSISREYGTSVDNLKSINNLTSNVLSVGQQLLVPVSEDVIDTSITNFTNYRVLSGDTLYSIASNNGVSVDELKSINNLSNDNLSVDQVLKIPVRETTIYIVKKGDTLYNISKEYNTNIDSIMKKNNLTSNLLSIGQQLIL